MPSPLVERYREYNDLSSGLGTYSAGWMLDEEIFIALFALGVVRLSNWINGYTVKWKRDEIDSISLVGRLEHPWSQKEDYFTSVLFVERHKSISSPSPRYAFWYPVVQDLHISFRKLFPGCTALSTTSKTRKQRACMKSVLRSTLFWCSVSFWHMLDGHTFHTIYIQFLLSTCTFWTLKIADKQHLQPV